MKRINSREELAAFARRMGLRADWHEPDEQEITARVEGASFDNAGFYPPAACPELDARAQEMCVVFSRTEPDSRSYTGTRPVEDLAVVNLATLCAWAAGTDS